MSPEALPSDWQARVVAMVRGAAPLDGGWFAGGVLPPERQIAVYEMMYRIRLYEALIEEVRGTVHLLGERAEPTLRAYLRDHPSRSWTLNRVADSLSGWLQARGEDAALVDMARLDHAVQSVFEAADEDGVRPEQLAAMPMLRLHRAVRLLRLGANVHEIRSAVLSREPVPGLVARSVDVLVFRRHIHVRHWEIPTAAAALLRRIDAHGSVATAVDEVVASGDIDADGLSTAIGGWFRDFAERQLLVVREP